MIAAASLGADAWHSRLALPLGTAAWHLRLAPSLGTVAWHLRLVEVAGRDGYRSKLTLARIGVPRPMSPQDRRVRNAVLAHPAIP